MPIFLWVIYPIAIWSACAGLMSSGNPTETDRSISDQAING